MRSILFFFAGLIVAEAADWTYEGKRGPSRWRGLCRSGKRQSPINIVPGAAINTSMGSLKFMRYDSAFTGAVTNTGHTVRITLTGEPIEISGGGLPGTYVLEEMHMHWRAEHTINRVRDPMELHLVHYDRNFTNSSVASKYPNGLAVVAVLFKLSDEDNNDLKDILEAVKSTSYRVGPNTTMISSKVTPARFLPRDRTTFYRYEGSLTTPGCQESVIWTILEEKLTISEAQLNILKKVQSRHGVLKSNYRPVQKLGKRIVYHHMEGYSSSPTATHNLQR